MNKYQVATAKEDGRVIQEYGVTWDASKVSTMQQHRRKPIKVARVCEKEKVTLEYTTPHTLQLNGVMERIFSFIK